MDKLSKLKGASDRAADKATAECAEKIKDLTDNQLGVLIDNLKQSSVDREVVAKLEKDIGRATDKNKVVSDVVKKSESVCKAVIDIIGRVF